MKRSFDRISVDGQLSTSDTVIAQANGASGVQVEPQSADELALGEALDALLRQLALEIVARRRGRPARRARGRDRPPRHGRAGGSRGGQLAARQDRRSTAAIPTSAASFRRPARCGRPASRSSWTSRSRATRWCRRATWSSRRPRSSCRATEVEYALTLPGEGGETEVFFSDLSPEYVKLQRGVHVMRDVATLLEALPYIRDFHGKTVVIKYGGAAMTEAELARGVRPRRGPTQVRGHEPGRGPRRRARHHELHGAARDGGAVRRGPARVRRGHRRGGEDGPGRQAEQGHRPADQPPRTAGGGPVRRRRPPLHGEEAARRRRDRHRLRRRDRDRGRGRAAPHRRGLHPGGGVGGRGRARAAPTT